MPIDHNQRGLTLIELVAVIAIMAIALIGVTQTISVVTRQSADTLLETRAVALAQSYLEEILGKRFDENSAPRGIPPCSESYNACTDESAFGPDGSEVRNLFDDVDDYHNLAEGDGEADPLLDSEGNIRAGYENFRVQVSVRYLRPCAEEAAWFNFAPEICSPDIEDAVQVEESEEVLGPATQSAKYIRMTVRHRDHTEGWHFSVYKANF